jgi:hypothetical protein
MAFWCLVHASSGPDPAAWPLDTLDANMARAAATPPVAAAALPAPASGFLST